MPDHDLRKSTSTRSLRDASSDNPTCARCNKPVYLADQTKAVNKTYHKTCLRCTALLPPVTSKADPKECGALLDSRTLRDHDGEPMCAQCHRRMHGAAGLAR
ncbi:hypothetical protein C8R43DRAFT_1138162 [Mycena crocata]|nr:hypothetical protein C8R43DRAFT_1138162 [Mycena crocata]